MNDEKTVVEDAQMEDCTQCGALPPQTAQATDARDGTASMALTEPSTVEAADLLFADTDADSDSDCKSAAAENEKGGLDELRSELMQLRQELNERNAQLAQMTRAERDFAEFNRLYPNVALSSLPESVWQEVADGSSLAAAYALAERREAMRKEHASLCNAQNRSRSAGAVKNAESLEFSPAEVRAMSSQEVRANLSKIMRSMQKWR